MGLFHIQITKNHEQRTKREGRKMTKSLKKSSKVVEGKRKRSAGWKEEGGQVYGCCYAEM